MKEKFKILIVDDDEGARKLHRKLIQNHKDYRIEEAENGQEALEKIEKSIPDIILSDLYMPIMDGLELCRKLKQDPHSYLANIYVIMISAIGGNGTFHGTHALCEYLPTGVQVFFVPVTIDSDVAGTDCIGQHTGVEMGAERIRCFMADARTHKRTYVVEMMGASSGFHALHSCLGARAHLAVLPISHIDHRKVAEALNQREECVIVVAEGYRKEERQAQGINKNAAEYFYDELLATGVEIKRKVVCEPFSRDIRGAAPNNLDISLAQRMAYNVANYLREGTSRLMPAVQSGREYAIPFNEIKTDNMKEEDLLVLADRLTKR